MGHHGRVRERYLGGGKPAYVQPSLETLFEHWDDTQWTAHPATFHGFINAISADAANDSWVVGYSGSFTLQTLAEHYDATAWMRIATPDVGSGSNSLSAVLALAPDNVWAVGYSTASTKPPPNQYDVPTKTLIEHYDGTSWSVVPSPNVAPNSQYQSNRLWSLTAVSPNDIWAFGSYNAASGNGNFMDLVMHWNGATWSLVSVPSPTPSSFIADELRAGVGLGPDNVWLVGSEDVAYTLVLHTASAN